MGSEQQDRQLAQTITEALRLRDRMKAEGASPDELAAGLERTVRASWPFTREWHYLCDSCDDLGLMLRECPRMPCGRRHTHLPHSYGLPCHCEKGRAFVPKAQREQPANAFTQATKVRQPTRFGR